MFADEFGGLAAVVAQNVSVEITPSAADAATAVLNEFPITEGANGLQVAMGDAYGGERRKLLAKFHLRPATTVGPIEVATLTIRSASTAGDVALHTVIVPVVATAANVAGADYGASAEVVEEVLRLEVARHRREAREAAERGEFDAASLLLAAGADMLERTGAAPGEIAEMRQVSFSLSEGAWSALESKRQFSRSRSTSKGRRTNYEPPSDPES